MIPGKTRTCPHCKATILESAVVCPGCNHHLRFDPSVMQQMQPAATPLKVEGTLRHPPEGDAWEYSIVLSVRNERGEEVTRQVVGVGALQPADQRTFTLAVELFVPRTLREVKPQEQPAAPAADQDRRAGFRDPRIRDPRSRPAGLLRDAGAAPPRGAPPLPPDPRPPAREPQARPQGSLPPDPTK
ncbi:MAG TPA: hypothetical protein VMB48_06290 [Steroidobacteraceae bacterium]|nr:hypothetical protein [Steroidobacteraceae bacterium]